MEYPRTRRSDVVDTLHGHRIEDPYRWLEDPDSEETRAWVAAQNEVTRAALEASPHHATFSELLRRIVLRPRCTAPQATSGWYLVSRNAGEAPQNTWYAARSLDELQRGGRVLFDPSSWSADGSASLSEFSFNPSGSLVAHSRSEGGSDWQIVSVTATASGETVESDVLTTKFSNLVWLDESTFLYNRYADVRVDGTDTTALPRPQLCSHMVGTDPGDDRLLLEFPDDPRVSMWPEVSSDGLWLSVLVNRGTEHLYRLWLFRVGVDGTVSEPLRVLDEYRDDVSVVDVLDDTLYLVTDREAPRSRVVALDLTAFSAADEAAWREIVPQREDTLVDARIGGGVIVTHHLHDAAPVLTRWSPDGECLGRVDLDGGTLIALSCDAGHDEMLVTFNSIASPVDSHALTPSTGEHRPISFMDAQTWTPPKVTITRHRATSKDGTQVPYWLARRADAPEGPLPTLAYGYGGFNFAMPAHFHPMHIAWIDAGGAVAIANLRGGGEYGTEWYEAGKREHKQNVFDDFAAVATDLVDSGATTRESLAVWGGSNGGLLIGALITQHPELVAAAVPAVGVLDLLRFHLFTIGHAWISDYGDPDVAEDFEVALAYSPLHNVRPGVHYPPTLVVTGDHDDRVVPSHSHKFTATLQHHQGGDAPILTRIETATGHGAGKSAAVAAQESADILTFVADHTGFTPRA